MSVSSDQQALPAANSVINHSLSPSSIWHPSQHARLTGAGLQVAMFRRHWADPKPYKQRPKHYLAKPCASPECQALHANSLLVLSLLYALIVGPYLGWIAKSSDHPSLHYLAIASCSYFLAEVLLRHPLQHPDKAQPSTFVDRFNSTALPAHRALYALTCFVWATTSYPAQMWQLQNMLGWLSFYRCITLAAERHLANTAACAWLSNKWFCRLSWCSRTAATLLILSMDGWSGYASAKLIAMLLVIAGIEQNPGPSKRRQQTQQGTDLNNTFVTCSVWKAICLCTNVSVQLTGIVLQKKKQMSKEFRMPMIEPHISVYSMSGLIFVSHFTPWLRGQVCCCHMCCRSCVHIHLKHGSLWFLQTLTHA